MAFDRIAHAGRGGDLIRREIAFEPGGDRSDDQRQMIDEARGEFGEVRFERLDLLQAADRAEDDFATVLAEELAGERKGRGSRAMGWR